MAEASAQFARDHSQTTTDYEHLVQVEVRATGAATIHAGPEPRRNDR